MMYSKDTFRQFCHEAAKQFLQTVVVIDNEAEYDMERIVREGKRKQAEEDAFKTKLTPPTGGVLSPSKGAQSAEYVETSTAEETPSTVEQKEPPPSDLSHVLDAKKLIDGFADARIICSVIRPDKDETQVVERAVNLALAADIVVVDWMLDKIEGEAGSKRARDIIQGIIEQDIQNRGRLRLIAVYTAEDKPGLVLDQLYEQLTKLKFPHDGITKYGKKLTIQNSHLKIVILSKPSVGKHAGAHPVPFTDLPGILLDHFCDLNMGLLPTVALHSIAAIREETHHLLAVLHGKLDPALVGHRCLLPHPEDAEEFCDDLISGELRSILSMKRVGLKYANKTAHKRWIGSKISPETPHIYKSVHLTREQAFSLVEVGDKAISKVLNELRIDWLKRKLAGTPEHKDSDGQAVEIEKATARILAGGASAAKFYKMVDDINEKTIPQILDGNEANGELANIEFSRLCSLKREAFGLRKPVEGWIPRLTLGTILQFREGDTDTFLICLQPRCDSIRLEKEKIWNFPFLVLEKAGSKMNIAIKAFDGAMKPVDKRLYYEPKPRNQIVYRFKSMTGDAIDSINENGIFKFKDDGNTKEFWWVADLKDFVAQKIADEISTRIGSVGFDEYEWLRRKSK